jgi:hypothetical protein
MHAGGPAGESPQQAAGLLHEESGGSEKRGHFVAYATVSPRIRFRDRVQLFAIGCAAEGASASSS